MENLNLQPENSPLLTLPGEIRNQIILYAFHRAPGTTPPSTLLTSAMAVPWTCRQLYSEYASVARSQGTIYPFSWTDSTDLLIRTRSLLDLRSIAEITRLMLRLPLNIQDTWAHDGKRFGARGFRFRGAGLTGVREAWFRFRGEHGKNVGGGPTREIVTKVLWRLLLENQIPHLAKIGFVHEGVLPLLSLTSLLTMLRSWTPLVVSTRWRVQSDFEHGRLMFVESGGARRRVEVLVGYSFREVEEYVEVCGEIAEGKHAEVVIARRRDCKYVPPLDQMTDDDLRFELHHLHTLFPVSTEEEPLLQPHIDRIRAMCSIE